MSDWKDRIISHPDVLGGRPVFRDTRVSVEFVLSLMGAGWTDEEIRKNWPNLVQDDLVAAKGFSAYVTTNFVSQGLHKYELEVVEGPVLQVTLQEDSTDARLDEQEAFDLFDDIEEDEGMTQVLNGDDIRDKLVAGVRNGRTILPDGDSPDSDDSE